MPPAAEGSFQGQCPTCSQVVAFAAEDRLGHLECPNCQTTALGAAFLRASTPPPGFGTARRAVSDDERTHLILDAVPLDDDDSGEAGEKPVAPPRRAAGEKGPAPRAPAYDPERTHLILDPNETADDDDIEVDADVAANPASAPTLPAPPSAPTAPGTPALAALESAPPPAPDEQPTRLFIDPAELKSVREATSSDDQKTHLFIPPVRRAVDDAGASSSASSASPASSAPAPSPLDGRRSAPPPSPADGSRSSPPPSPREHVRARAEPPRDERTKLMLGPIVLKDEPVSVPPASSKKSAPVARRLGQLGLWIDDVMHERWPLALVAAAIVCGLLSPFTDATDDTGASPSTLPAIAFFIGLVAFVLAWASKLPSEADGGKLAAALARVQGATRLLIDDAQALGAAP
ncbi:MAG TPA: hypothetical protein VMG12_10920, partial [Polyangiaceae bacterium]|nr:hypothetical protein [Polyangiaceae bacterium]